MIWPFCFFPARSLSRRACTLQARSPFPRTHVVSMANQAVGYVPTRTAYAQGGYEPGHAARTHGMTEAAEEMITEAAVRLLLRSWEKTVRRG